MTSTLIRLDSKPQGAIFTGRVEIEAPATWAKYVLPESRVVVWQQTIGLDVEWWKDGSPDAILSA